MSKKINFLIILVAMLFLFGGKQVNFVKAETFYEGELGNFYKSVATEFRFYIVDASEVKLNIKTGVKTGEYNMTQFVANVWYSTISGDLNGQEYSYKVTKNSIIYENVLDPYSTAVSLDGQSSIVVRVEDSNPPDWNLARNFTVYEKASVIYGVHVEDFSSDPSWNYPGFEDAIADMRGKFAGLILRGTNINSINTGFDYLINLGFSHLEVMPIYDANLTSYGSGYLSYNPFAISRRYSSNESVYSPIMEFKNVVMNFNQRQIGVLMKVDFTNYNVDACQRLKLIDEDMVDVNCKINFENDFAKRYLKELYTYYTKDFRVSGFNIMDLNSYPVEFLNSLEEELKVINPNILIYGSGSYSEEKEGYASEKELQNLNNIKLINTSLSGGLFGSLYDNDQKGVLTGDYSISSMESIKFGMLGSINNDQVDYDEVRNISFKGQWVKISTLEIINSLGGYEGLTMYDKLLLSDPSFNNEKYVKKMRSAYLTLFMSGGIPYIYNGEEFLKSRLISNDLIDSVVNKVCSFGRCYSSAAWETGDPISWDLRVSNSTLVNTVKSIMNIRQGSFYAIIAGDVFIKENFEFINDKDGFLSYLIKTETNKIKEVENIFFAINYNDLLKEATVPPGYNWTASFIESSNVVDDGIELTANGYYMCFSIKKPPFPNWFSFIFVLLLIGLIYGANLLMSKKIIEKKGDLNIKGKRKYLAFLKKDEPVNKEKD